MAQEQEQMQVSLSPTLHEEEYVFLSSPSGVYGDLAHLQPIAMFAEPEGLSLVAPRSAVDLASVDYDSVQRLVSLGLNSSLDGVGLTATIAVALADKGIAANVIAAYHHDHILVPADRAEDAVKVLQGLSWLDSGQ